MKTDPVIYVTDPDPYVYKLTEQENMKVKLHNTTDAQVWTDEFIKTLNKLYPHFGNYVRVGEGADFNEWVFGWFCNAIQTGIDLTNNERDNRCVYILQSNSGENVKIWNNGFEPSEDEMDEAYSEYLYRVAGHDGRSCSASINCTLFRWSKYNGLECWHGKAIAETKYNWTK